MEPSLERYQKSGIDDAKITAPPKFVIENVRVFDGYAFGKPCSVAVEQGRIAQDTTNAVSIDGKGCYLLPGFIDSHAHPIKLADLEAFREFGVTTVMELGNPKGPLGNEMKGLIGLPDLYCAGYVAAAPEGTHAKFMDLPAESLPTTPAKAVRFVGERIADGADYIKIISDLPGLDQVTMNALVDQAKQNELLTHAHAVELESYRKARRARASMIHHVPCDEVLTMEEAAAGSDYVAVPTLAVMKAMTNIQMPDRPDAFNTPVASAKALCDAGIPILAGSDACIIEGVPVQMAMGDSLHEEMELLVTAAGLSLVEALRAATVLPPKYFRLSDRGEVKPGFRADLVLLRSNPLQDIRATRSIERIWLNGVEHRPKKNRAANS